MLLTEYNLTSLNKTLSLLELQRNLSSIEKGRKKRLTANRPQRGRETGGDLSDKEIKDRARRSKEQRTITEDLTNPHKKVTTGGGRTGFKASQQKVLRESARKRMRKLALQATRNSENRITSRDATTFGEQRKLTDAERKAHAQVEADKYLREPKDLSNVSLNPAVTPPKTGEKKPRHAKGKTGKGKVENRQSRVTARAKPNKNSKVKQIAADVRNIQSGRVPKSLVDSVSAKFKPKKARKWQKGQGHKRGVTGSTTTVTPDQALTSNLAPKKVRGTTVRTGKNQLRGLLGAGEKNTSVDVLVEQVNDLKKVYISEFAPRRNQPKLNQNRGVGNTEAPNKVGAPSPVKINEIVDNYKKRISGKGRPKAGIINQKDLNRYWKKRGYKGGVNDKELKETKGGSVRTYAKPPPPKGVASPVIGRKLGEGTRAGQQNISSDKPSKVNQIAVDAAKRTEEKKRERKEAQAKHRKQSGKQRSSRQRAAAESKRIKEEFQQHLADSKAGQHRNILTGGYTSSGSPRKVLPKAKTYKGYTPRTNMVLSLDEIRGIYKGLSVKKTEADQSFEGEATRARALSGVKTHIRQRKDPDKIRSKLQQVTTPKASGVHANRLGFASDLRRHAKSIEDLENNIGLMATIYKAHYVDGTI